MRTGIALFIVLLCATPAARGQDSLMVLPHLESPFVFDGMPDGPRWAAVPPLPVVHCGNSAEPSR